MPSLCVALLFSQVIPVMHQEGTQHQRWTSLEEPDWTRVFSEKHCSPSDWLPGPWWWFASCLDWLLGRNWIRPRPSETPDTHGPSLWPKGETMGNTGQSLFSSIVCELSDDHLNHYDYNQTMLFKLKWHWTNYKPIWTVTRVTKQWCTKCVLYPHTPITHVVWVTACLFTLLALMPYVSSPLLYFFTCHSCYLSSLRTKSFRLFTHQHPKDTVLARSHLIALHFHLVTGCFLWYIKEWKAVSLKLGAFQN